MGVNHVCILGPSGIGKSPLASLFRFAGLDPLRVREPRDAKDSALCISEPDAIQVYNAESPPGAAPWPTPKAPENWFVVGRHWLFLSVRGDRQCLRFQEDNGELVLRSPKRVEIFAPRLVDILNLKSETNIGLWPDNLVVLLLNPSATKYREMAGDRPDEDLKQATFYAITKRTELQRKPVDVPDAQKRVRRLPAEVAAWVEIGKLVGEPCVEYTSWQHFEFRYHQPDSCPADAKRELIEARDTILAGLNKVGNIPPVQALLSSGGIRSVTEILGLADIV